MKLKPYPKYKDSGIQWIGEIPEGWDPIRLKYLLNRIDSGCWGSDFDEKGTIILRSTEIKVDGSWQIDDPATRSITEKERSNCLLKEGDLLVTKSSGSEKHIGKTALVNKDIEKLNCCFSNFMTRLRPNRNQKSKILHYFLNSDNARSQFNYFSNSTVGLGNLNEDCFKNLIFVKIPLDEQVKIQNFLDKKNAKIDAMIEKDKKLIALLKEKRTALINHAVTKGLDPNVKLKDSGIEWVGKIPEGREINKVKHKYNVIDGDRGKEYPSEDDLKDSGIPFLSAECIDNFRLFMDKSNYISEDKFHKLGRGKLKDKDIILTVRGTIGKAAVFLVNTHKTGFINAEMMILRKYDNLKYEYLFYIISCDVWQKQVDFHSYGTAQKQLNNFILKNILIPIPSIEEQTQIVEYLDKTTSKIDKTIKLIEKKIELLQEFKKSLIHHVVTGKMDVRGVEA